MCVNAARVSEQRRPVRLCVMRPLMSMCVLRVIVWLPPHTGSTRLTCLCLTMETVRLRHRVCVGAACVSGRRRPVGRRAMRPPMCMCVLHVVA